MELAVPPELGVTGFDAKLVVTPAGAPEALKLTAELKLFREVTLTLVMAKPGVP